MQKMPFLRGVPKNKVFIMICGEKKAFTMGVDGEITNSTYKLMMLKVASFDKGRELV